MYKANGLTATYTNATITVDGATYIVPLATAISYNNLEEDVNLYVITLKVNTTVSGSAAPYGSAVVNAGGKDFTVTSTAANPDGGTVTFHAPNITDAVTLKSTTPATNYTNKTGNNWTVVSTDRSTGYKFAPSAATTVTAYFTPHGVLDFSPDPITASVKAGYTDRTIVAASTDGASDGYLENVGPGAIPGITYTLTKTGSTNWTPGSSLTITGMPTSLTKDGAAGDWGGVKIDLKNGLGVGTYTANLTISSTDSDVADLVVPITITVKEGSVAAAKGDNFKWDTYTQAVTQNKSPNTATTTWTTNLTLEDIVSVDSLVYGATTLVAGTDYTLGTKAGSGEDTYIPVTLTNVGLKKLAGLIKPSASGVIVVSAKDSSGAIKQANITMNLEDTMPALDAASFSNLDSNGEWALGGTAPSLTVTDNISGSTALTGDVTYVWSINGTVQSAWASTKANLTAADLASLNVGDTVSVTATGTGKAWEAKPSSTTNLYKETVSKTASFKVKAPEVTVKIKLDGNDYTTPGSGDRITASKSTLGSGVLLQTGTNNAKKYVFVNWTLETSGGGIFGVSGSATTSTDATSVFTPSKAATVVANWVSVATVEYTHGATATGPNDAAKTKYSETLKNVGAKATTITDIEIDDTTNFTLTVPNTGVKGALAAGATTADSFVITPKTGIAAGTYPIEVTTTYTNAAPDGADATTATVVQTVYYTVPEPTYVITLAATAGGTNRGNYKGTNKNATSGTNQTFTVVKNDSVALTAIADTGYKFVNWTLATAAGTSSDKLSNPATDASNAYGAVTAANTITANFKAITDLAEANSQTSKTVNVGYSGAQDVYLGTVTNSGAKTTSVKYELSGSDAANFTIATPSLTGGIANIGAGAPTASGNIHNVKVQAVAGLGVGTYHANLVITEQTADADDTKNGIQTWTIPITFTVGGGTAEVEVKLNTTNKNKETVTLLAGTSVIAMTQPASGNKYTASGLTIGTAYQVLVNGVNTGVTVTANNATTAGTATVQLWTLTTADDGNGTVSVSGGTQVTITEGTGATTDDSIGYVNNSNVTISGVPNANYHFKEWEDKNANLGWTSNKDTTNPKTIAMTAARSVEAHFEKNIEKDTYYAVKYYKNYDGNKGTTTSDYLFEQSVMQGNSVALYAGPTRPGYTFVKWINSDGTDCANPLTPTTDVNVFATWQKADATWANLPDGVYGTSYSANALVTNGDKTGPVEYSYTGTKTGGSGTTAAPYNGLPDGLTLAQNGTISGTPAETGVFKFQVTATGTGDSNSGLTWTKDYTITIDKAQPTLSGVSFAGVAEGAAKTDVTVYGKVHAPLYTTSSGTSAWVSGGKDYDYTASATPSPNPGALSVKDPATLSFNGATTLSGTVQFIPSTSVATGYAGTHQNAQKFSDVYKNVEDPCVFNLGGQVWDVEVDPANKTFGPYAFGTATTTDTQAFKVTNKGNQDVYLQYVWNATTSDFGLTVNTYNHPTTTPTCDKLDTTTTKEIENAFNVAPTLSATKAPGTYTANVAVKVYKDAACTELAKTILVPVTYTITSTDYDVTVQIDLNPVSGTKQTKQQVPNNGAVTFKASDGTTIAGVWDATDKVYKAKLPGGKAYSVYVNGIDTTKDVDTNNKSATVDMYELALDQDSTSKGVQDITSALAGKGYYLASQSVTISAPPSCGAASNNYDFTKWTNGSTDVATTNTHTYTMPAEATTLVANYTKRAADTVVINYHSNYGTDTVLWNQVVTKSKNATLSSTVPTRNGYVFKEWNTLTDGTGSTYAAGGTVLAANLGDDLDLYAQWTKLTATFPASLDNTYYSAHYSASVAVTGWKNGDAAANAPAVTYSVVDASGDPANLPAGLKIDGNTGVITGRPYVVDGKPAEGATPATPASTKFYIKATAVDDANTSWTSGELSIIVDKAQPRLANASGENAHTGSAYSTGDYYADVVADILKTAGATADDDVWEDGKTIIAKGSSANNNGLYYKGSSGTVSKTSKANGGELEPESGTFSSGNNAVELTWTPGDTAGTYPLVDGHSNKWGDIFKPAKTTVGVTPGDDSWTMTAGPATIKFKVVKDSGAYQVLDNGTYVAIGSSTADNITLTNTGTRPVYATWDLDATTYFSAPTAPSSRQALATTNATHTITAVPSYDDVIGTYTSQVTVTYYDAATGGNEKGTATVTLVLEVIEADTFPFEVDTYLNTFNASGAGTAALGDVTSVTLESTDATPVAGTAGTKTDTGKYPFTLDVTKNYKVKVNGIELPGVLVNKTSTSPLRVDLYQLTLAHDGHGSADPTAAATSPSTSSGYYLPGERVTATAAAGASGYKFKSWDETLENKADADTTNADFSKANPLSYVMGDKAVKLTANYEIVGARFKVVLDVNDSTNTAAIGYYTNQSHKDALHGGAWEDPHYMVDDGAVFGLDMPVTTAAAGKYTIAWQDHTFLGWSIDPNATSGGYSFTASQAAANADRAAGVTDDDDTITLYAIWSADNTLALAPVTITGVYKHTIADVYNGATGGTKPYVSYVGANEAFSATDLIFGLKLETVGSGAHAGESKVSGTPDDVGTKVSDVTVTDSRTPANTATARYTIVIEKANVLPDPANPLPKQVEIANGTSADDIKTAVITALGSTIMDGDGTNEKNIHGTWEVVGTPSTDPGSHTVTVKFTPTNATTATAGKDHDDTKDGNHYNEYTTTIPVVIGGKLITDADLDTTGTMAAKVGSNLVFTVPTTNRTLDPNGNTGDPTYTNGSTKGDVVVSAVKWTKNGTELTATELATGGNDYALYITLTIEEGSTWRFDPDEFNGSTIAGLDATKIAVNDTMAVLRVNFPKQITIIDVATNTPIHNSIRNEVWVPASHENEYDITSYKWYESTATPATSGEVGSGATGSEVKFDEAKYYDLVVTVKPKTGMDFSDTIKGLANGASMNDCDGTVEDTDIARVNNQEPDKEADLTDNKKFVRVESHYDEATNTITIRYRAFQPANQTLIGLRVEGTPGVYYAQTEASRNHFKLTNSVTPTVGNTGSKDKVTFNFDFSRLRVIPLYQSADGATIAEGTALAAGSYTVTVDGGKSIPADGFKDQYTHNSVARADVNDFDNKTLVVSVGSVKSSVAGTLRVQQLRADMMTVFGTVSPKLHYELGDRFSFDSAAAGALTADIDFNLDIAELENPVNGLTYAPYSTLTANPDSKTYFLEYGVGADFEAIPHKPGDPSSLDTGALFTELIPGTTPMTADMDGKKLYATYVDVNHNVVRTSLGIITLGSDFITEITDVNLNDPEYADELVGTPKVPDGKGGYTNAPDPNNYTYVWEYWKPTTPGADPDSGNGTWETISGETDRTHYPEKNEVGEYVRVVATDRATGTSQPSDPELIMPRSLNFIVKPWNKAPDGDSRNIHSYDSSDFTFTAVEKVWDDATSAFKNAEHIFGGVANNDALTLTPAANWNNTALAGNATAVNARPNYRHGNGWSSALGGAVGDEITWPVVREDLTVVLATTTGEADKTGGYNLGGAGVKVAATLNGATNVAVYRLRDQDQQLHRGTILAVDIIDENGHDPEYGDKLTADPQKPDGTPDNDPNLTYQWEKKNPDTGEWEPIPGETGKDHFPGKEEVGEEIRVVVTDPEDGTKRESQPKEIYPRSLNFVVDRKNRLHTDDADAANRATYGVADFTLTSVKADAAKDASGAVTMDATNKMATFTATNTYGGLYSGDAVTLAPRPTNTGAGYTSWNAEATNPNYRTATDTAIATGNANGEVGSKIIWPQVFDGNEAKGSTNTNKVYESAGQTTDYVLGGTGLKNTKGEDVYRLAPQDEQLDRGEITGDAGGHVMHVNVDFQNYPTIASNIPGHPDAEASNATGDDNDGSPKKDVAVTDKRETRPGEVLDHNDDTHRTDGTDGYPGSAYIAKWYPAQEGTTGNGDWAKNFDPTNPTATGGNALSGTFDGSAATVVVKVTPRAGYKYEMLGEKPDNAKTATKFHFHFSKDFTVDLPVATTGPAGVRKVTETKDGKNYDVYYMWYTFTDLTTPPFVSDPLDLGLTPDDFIYYANTDAANPATGDHHHAVNTADNVDIPGGKASVPFQYKLQTVINAINNSGAGTALMRTDGSAITLNSANYGTTWRLKAGTWSGSADKELAATANSTTGRTFKDTVNLLGSAGGTANTGDSQVYDGLYVYIEVTVGTQNLVYGAPLGVTAGGVVTPEPLTVKELEAQSITANGTPTLAYTAGKTFDASGVTSATVKFNMGTADYTVNTRADAQDIDYTDATANEGKVYFFQVWDATNKFQPFADGASLTTADNGKIVYICYTDVNNHIVRQALGALQIKEAPNNDIGRITITYPEPVTDKTPTSKRNSTLWTYDDLTKTDEVKVAETALASGDPRTNGTTWYTTTLTSAPADAAAIKALAVDANKLDATDKFAAGTYYMVQGKIEPQKVTVEGVEKTLAFDTTNGVKVNINGIDVEVGKSMGTRNDGTTAVAWAMAEYNEDKSAIIVRYVAKTPDKNEVGSVSINYTTPVATETVLDYSSYADTKAVTVPDKTDANNPTKWYKVSDTADTAFNTSSLAALTIDTDTYVAGGVYVVENLVKPNGDYKLDTSTVVNVDGKVKATVTTAGAITASGATTGLVKVKATLNNDGTITVQSLYKVPDFEPEAVDSISITYPEPIKDQTPTSVRTGKDKLWTYNALSDDSKVSVSETVDSAVTVTPADENKTAGTTWYTTTLTGKPANAAAVQAQATTANRLTAAFVADTYYMVEGIITPASTDYTIAANAKVTINGILVTVDGAVETKKDAKGDDSWAVAVKDGNNIKAYYIAKTRDDTEITAVSINYTTPVSTNKADEYVNYLDREMVTVDQYNATTAPNGTRWYPVSSANDFSTSGTMMTIGTTEYAEGKYYLVENVIKPKAGTDYKLTASTKVYVDGVLEVAADTNGGVATTSNTDGLRAAKAVFNAADGTITIQSIYKVPDFVPGKINSISITYPEPKELTSPTTKREPTLWTWEYLYNDDQVSVSDAVDGAAPKTQGSTWYKTDLTDADKPFEKVDFTPPTDPAKKLNGDFEYDTYYMVEGTITADTGYAFDNTVYVTINGILVTVGGDVRAKYDNDGNEIGWAMAVKDGDAIKARYIAKTGPAPSEIIYRVQATVAEPVADDTISGSATTLEIAFFDNDTIATSNVTIGATTWKEATSFGGTYGTPATNKFRTGYYYQAEFEVETKDKFLFENETDNYVAFKINGINKGDDWGINNAKTPDETTSGKGVWVHSEKVDGNPNKYRITVRFPRTGELKDIKVIGKAKEPVAKAVIANENISVDADKPYQIKTNGGAEEKHWEHWNGAAWVPTTAGETFIAGDYYRAVMDVELKAGQENFYEFTRETEGEVNDSDASSADNLPNDKPTRNALRTTILHKPDTGTVTTITLAKEFRVERTLTKVLVEAPEPKAGVYSNDADIKIYKVDENGKRYELTNDALKGKWYTSDGTPLNGASFEAGKTYHLKTLATAKDVYHLYGSTDGYEWYVGNDNKLKDAKFVVAQQKSDDGDILSSNVTFEYSIPAPQLSLIPGWAEQPVTGSALSNIRTEYSEFEVVGEPWWTKDEQNSDDHIAVGATAMETSTYYAHIKVKAKPGVFVRDEDAYYRFNYNDTTDQSFVWHKGEKDADGQDIYYLTYKFEPTEKAPEPSNGGGGGTTTVENPVVYYHLKDQGVTADPTAEKVRKNGKPKSVPTVTAIGGLVFKGWSEVDPSTLTSGTLPTLVDPTTFKITKDKTFYAVYERGVDHDHYVIGFPNGTFAPDAKITRAEVATIIARSCLEGFVEGANYGNPGNYSDVTSHWAFSAIAFCAREGVFNGYEDGTFRPDRYITRQELATVVARLAGIQTSQGMPFNDRNQIASWATNGVYTAYANGWVNGYEDNTFQPEREISRAETVKIFNGYLKRGVNAKGLDGLKEYVHSGVASNNTENRHDEYMTWPDVPKTHWAYYEIIEAANDHNYHWQDAEKQTPPEDWDEVYIDEKWRYYDNEGDGADTRDENMSAQKIFTVTYLVSSNGVTYDAITETVERFASPKPENMPIAVPNEGYRFAGWSSTDPSTGTITLEDPTASSVTADKWFYAVFEEDKPYQLPVYTVTYVIGALGSYDGATVEQVEMFQAPSPANLPKPVVNEGYHLAGWSETDPANGEYVIVDPTANYVTGDKTFYAVYEENKPYVLPIYTVTYVIGTNGSYRGATTEQVEMFQAPSPAKLPKPTANRGYKFVGWSETDPANGGYAIVDPTANYITGDKTFYAVYKAV